LEKLKQKCLKTEVSVDIETMTVSNQARVKTIKLENELNKTNRIINLIIIFTSKYISLMYDVVNNQKCGILLILSDELNTYLTLESCRKTSMYMFLNLCFGRN